MMAVRRQRHPRHVLVTGVAGGIGGAVVDVLRSAGTTVTAVDTVPGDNPGSTGDCRFVELDVTDPAQVKNVVEESWSAVGPVDALVNAAGVFVSGPGATTTDEQWRRLFDVNAFGVFAMCRELAPRMAERGRGSIVTVGSNAGSVPRAMMAAYAASKSAASSVTRSFGLEYGPDNVRCNVVCPGTTRTPMIDGLASEADLVAGQPGTFKAGIPLGRIAEPVDIADVVVFLAGDSARHLTLQEVVVDGGASQR